MRNRNAGRITERLWYLGQKESGIYLLVGDRDSLILSGGMSYLAPVVVEQMRDFGIDEAKIGSLLILHSHFDHAGLVPFFKRRHPALRVYASARAWEILRMAKGIETINAFSRMVAERMGQADRLAEHDLDWRDDVGGETVAEGSVIDLGGVTVRVIETPGHSSCSISAYCPELRALFPSDGGGIPYEEMILPAGNSNYTRYQQSLEKLLPLEVDIFCADHYGYLTGPEAKGYLAASIEAAREYRGLIEATLRDTGSIDTTVAKLLELYTSRPGYFLSPEIYAGVSRQTVRHIAAELEKRNGGGPA